MAQFKREDTPLALNHGGGEKPREARAIQRGRHGDQPQIGAQSCLGVKRKGKAKIAIEAAFMHFVKQDRRDTRQLRVRLYPVAENAFG